jgi:hypothetical protein
LLVVRSRHTFVRVPLVARLRPAASQAVGETGGELLASPRHRPVGDNDATLSQDQLDITQIESLFVGGTSLSMRLRLQSSVELPVTP